MKRLIHLLFYGCLKPFVWFYVVVFQHVRFHKRGFKLPKGPVLVLSNHHSDWDGIYINLLFFSRIFHFIVHDEMFKNRFLAFLSGVVLGEVKRGMTHSDISDILEMKRLVKKGRNIAIYPEGDIDMFGRTMPVSDSIARFVKMMGVPVVLCRIEGASVRAPRWAKYPRHNPIDYSVYDMIDVETISKSSNDEIYERIMKTISADDFAVQAKAKRRLWPGPSRAKWLELGLYRCPKCHRYESLFSKGKHLTCRECGLQMTFTRECTLTSEEPLAFHELTAFEDWQTKMLMDDIKALQPGALLLETHDLDFYLTKQTEYFKKPVAHADTLAIYEDRIVYHLALESEPHQLAISEITRVNLQYKDTLEIHFGSDRIRFRTQKRKWSAYLYVQAISKLQAHRSTKETESAILETKSEE